MWGLSLNCVVMLSHSGLVTDLALTGHTAYLPDDLECDPMAVWLRSLAMASTCGLAAVTLGFPEPRGESTQNNKSCHTPCGQGQMGTSCFPLVILHLASIFIPSIGLEDIIAHTEALTKFTQKLFYDS